MCSEMIDLPPSPFFMYVANLVFQLCPAELNPIISRPTHSSTRDVNFFINIIVFCDSGIRMRFQELLGSANPATELRDGLPCFDV